MAIYSKATQHAVSMLTHIAMTDANQFSSVREVSTATGISEPTVAKTLQVLVKEGLLGSRKGPGGGFYLAEDTDSITLGRIVRAIEGRELFAECVAGLKSCSEENVCPLHEKWSLMKQGLIDFLDSTTLSDMVLAVKNKGF